MCHEVDFTQPEALDATLARFGQLDIELVNARVVTVGSVERDDPHASERAITVNLPGAWQTVRAVLPHVIATQSYILFVSSLAGTVQGPLHAAYNSSKAGLQAFANTLRLEVGYWAWTWARPSHLHGHPDRPGRDGTSLDARAAGTQSDETTAGRGDRRPDRAGH